MASVRLPPFGPLHGSHETTHPSLRPRSWRGGRPVRGGRPHSRQRPGSRGATRAPTHAAAECGGSTQPQRTRPYPLPDSGSAGGSGTDDRWRAGRRRVVAGRGQPRRSPGRIVRAGCGITPGRLRPSPKTSFRALTQYNSLSKQWSASARFRYTHRPGSDLYIVCDEVRRNLAGVPSRDDFLARQLIRKATYLFSM